ncbi:NAD(P)/FAD-dependent oxidoreductase [Pseudobacter ginsenosidimutans]|uniref:Thioredoxin reductase n=1 Tax=Pseudobacter ginsenosidimutans TaxID=661488 RepID=A0A4Q7N651_9BACT|nr:NAD(P)/FAD-dependent oxidoreductase [Pseudobacter ginsenosidimutans]QEC45045.1 NAD(P)/FAD-dependent oxidoreductase [Pseudobacter ginsenosidimutans]RZS76539.1 thioredoxin reductase [Pseudobacter ginsenosidimutans]
MHRKAFINRSVLALMATITGRKALFSQQESTQKNYKPMDFEVAIIGGASAGLSAAMALGRSIRKTIVIDGGSPRNKPAPHAHNIFTRDGTPPLELLDIAKAQLKPYTTVTFKTGKVISANLNNNLITLTTDSNETFTVRRLILATGLTDVLPAIKGFRELWGTKIVHCPYCHGYELKDQPVGILMNGKNAEHITPMVFNLNKSIHIFTNGRMEFSEQFLKWTNKQNIRITETEVDELADVADGVQVRLKDGSSYLVTGIYSKGDKYKFHNELAVQLGCKLSEEGAVQVDDMFSTTVPGVYAAGDLAHASAHQVIIAAAGGAKAGMACNNSLTMEDYEHAQ